MNEQDRNRLRDILDAARLARHISAGKTRASLDDDIVIVLALTRVIEIIGEAANRVSPETQAALTTIPWRNIIGMRNRVVHDYGSVNYDILWKSVTEGIAELIEAVEQSLSAESPDNGAT
jgi:uncharacterized protein with HEPN domain